MESSDEMAQKRERCLQWIAASGFLSEPRVLAALRAVPREKFVPPAQRHLAWEDYPLPIGENQTISAPHMYALMAQAADLRPGLTVLEIGTGSGYGAALAKELVGPKGKVYSVELHPALAASARKALKICHYDAKVIVGDGHAGYAPGAPYDRILVTAAADTLPPALWSQLKTGGRLLIPLGGSFGTLMLYEKTGPDVPAGVALGAVAFVPLQRPEP